MPEFKLGFLCANPNDSCTLVKNLMGSEFKEIINLPKNSNYDHVGILKVNNILEAIQIKKTLESKAGKHLRSIEIDAS